MVDPCEREECTGQLVYGWDEIDERNAVLFGQKCARLAIAKRAGVPIPPFFAITQCGVRQILDHGGIPAALEEEVESRLARLAAETGCAFDDRATPLVVAVRSGDPFSMAGAMFSYLNVGVNERTVGRLVEQYDDEPSFLRMYLDSLIDHAFIVERRPRHQLARLLDAARRERTDAARLRALIAEARAAAPTFPEDARRHLSDALRAVAFSWHNYVTTALREEMEVEGDLLPSIFVQQMAFGTLSSSAFLAFCTRNPITGEEGFSGDFALGTEGRKMMRGIGPERHDIGRLGELFPEVVAELRRHVQAIEALCRRPQDIEAIVERGRLRVLQIVDAHLSPAARRRITADFRARGLLAEGEQIAPIPGIRRTRVIKTYKLRPGVALAPLGRGQPVHPGVAEGRLALCVDDAIRLGLRHGKRTILLLSRPDERALPMLLKRQVEGFAASYGSTHDVAAAMLSHMPSAMSVNVATEGNNYLVTEGGERIAAGRRVILDGTGGRLYLTPEGAEPALIEDEPILVTPHNVVGSRIEQETRDEYGALSYEELLAAHARRVAEIAEFTGSRDLKALSDDETMRFARLELITHFIHIMIFERASERGVSYVDAQLDVAVADGSLDRVPGLEHKKIALERDGDSVRIIVATTVSYDHEEMTSAAFDDGEIEEIMRRLAADGIPARLYRRQRKLTRHTQFVTTTCVELPLARLPAAVARLQEIEAGSRE